MASLIKQVPSLGCEGYAMTSRWQSAPQWSCSRQAVSAGSASNSQTRTRSMLLPALSLAARRRASQAGLILQKAPLMDETVSSCPCSILKTAQIVGWSRPVHRQLMPLLFSLLDMISSAVSASSTESLVAGGKAALAAAPLK